MVHFYWTSTHFVSFRGQLRPDSGYGILLLRWRPIDGLRLFSALWSGYCLFYIFPISILNFERQMINDNKHVLYIRAAKTCEHVFCVQRETGKHVGFFTARNAACIYCWFLSYIIEEITFDFRTITYFR